MRRKSKKGVTSYKVHAVPESSGLKSVENRTIKYADDSVYEFTDAVDQQLPMTKDRLQLESSRADKGNAVAAVGSSQGGGSGRRRNPSSRIASHSGVSSSVADSGLPTPFGSEQIYKGYQSNVPFHGSDILRRIATSNPRANLMLPPVVGDESFKSLRFGKEKAEVEGSYNGDVGGGSVEASVNNHPENTPSIDRRVKRLRTAKKLDVKLPASDNIQSGVDASRNSLLTTSLLQSDSFPDQQQNGELETNKRRKKKRNHSKIESPCTFYSQDTSIRTTENDASDTQNTGYDTLYRSAGKWRNTFHLVTDRLQNIANADNQRLTDLLDQMNSESLIHNWPAASLVASSESPGGGRCLSHVPFQSSNLATLCDFSDLANAYVSKSLPKALADSDSQLGQFSSAEQPLSELPSTEPCLNTEIGNSKKKRLRRHSKKSKTIDSSVLSEVEDLNCAIENIKLSELARERKAEKGHKSRSAVFKRCVSPSRGRNFGCLSNQKSLRALRKIGCSRREEECGLIEALSSNQSILPITRKAEEKAITNSLTVDVATNTSTRVSNRGIQVKMKCVYCAEKASPKRKTAEIGIQVCLEESTAVGALPSSSANLKAVFVSSLELASSSEQKYKPSTKKTARSSRAQRYSTAPSAVDAMVNERQDEDLFESRGDRMDKVSTSVKSVDCGSDSVDSLLHLRDFGETLNTENDLKDCSLSVTATASHVSSSDKLTAGFKDFTRRFERGKADSCQSGSCKSACVGSDHDSKYSGVMHDLESATLTPGQVTKSGRRSRAKGQAVGRRRSPRFERSLVCLSRPQSPAAVGCSLPFEAKVTRELSMLDFALKFNSSADIKMPENAFCENVDLSGDFADSSIDVPGATTFNFQAQFQSFLSRNPVDLIDDSNGADDFDASVEDGIDVRKRKQNSVLKQSLVSEFDCSSHCESGSLTSECHNGLSVQNSCIETPRSIKISTKRKFTKCLKSTGNEKMMETGCKLPVADDIFTKITSENSCRRSKAASALSFHVADVDSVGNDQRTLEGLGKGSGFRRAEGRKGHGQRIRLKSQREKTLPRDAPDCLPALETKDIRRQDSIVSTDVCETDTHHLMSVSIAADSCIASNCVQDFPFRVEASEEMVVAGFPFQNRAAWVELDDTLSDYDPLPEPIAKNRKRVWSDALGLEISFKV